MVLGLMGLRGTQVEAQTPQDAVSEVEHAIAQAIIKKDIPVLETSIADDYSSYGYGSVKKATKADFIAAIKSPDYVVSHFKYAPWDVRILGSTAIVQGSDEETSSYQGKDISSTDTWLDVFEKRDGRWLLIANECAKVIAPAASGNADSLLKADRALAAQSHTDGFVAAYSKAMASGARKLDGGAPAVVGRDAILAAMAKYPADLALDWTPQEAVVADSGELGFTWGNYVATFHDKAGKLVTEDGKYLDVWRRQDDGVWRWIADMGNDNTVPAALGSSEKRPSPDSHG